MRRANERVSGFLKQVRVRLRESGKFAPRHRMSPEKNGAGFFLFEKFNVGSADSQLGAASVGDQGVRRGVLCDFGQDVQGHADRQRNVYQVGAAKGGVGVRPQRLWWPD